MYQTMLTTTHWLSLNTQMKTRLAEIFNLVRSGSTFVQDGIVVSDGFNHDDLQKINIETMQKYLNSDKEDFAVLFNEVLEKVHNEIIEKEQAQQIKNKEFSDRLKEEEIEEFIKRLKSFYEALPGEVKSRVLLSVNNLNNVKASETTNEIGDKKVGGKSKKA